MTLSPYIVIILTLCDVPIQYTLCDHENQMCLNDTYIEKIKDIVPVEFRKTTPVISIPVNTNAGVCT